MSNIQKKLRTKTVAVKKPLKKKTVILQKKAVKKAVPKKPRKATLKVSLAKKKPKKSSALQLEKFHGNPIIIPSERPWESRATFNPGAVYEDGSVHLLYRAIGESDVSVLGYASSKDGLRIDRRLDAPAYVPREPFEGTSLRPADTTASWGAYMSGGGTFGGCEDPRLTKIDGKIYVTYTAYDGWSAPAVALSSINIDDFLLHRWHWKKPTIISPPREAHKNWVIFPEKINGKYAILHSLCPTILIEYLDSLDFDSKSFIKSVHRSAAQKKCWDTRIRGVGPPPLKTKDGWLLFYHATDDKDPGKYKIGAMMLDSNDPTKILYRASEPILEPETHYENGGWKGGIVYSCGAVIKPARPGDSGRSGGNDELFVYYGGADSVACVATAPLKTFLNKLKRTGAPKIHPRTTSPLKTHVGR